MSTMHDLDTLMRDKVDTHCREQLSAMLDGELAPDQARFLLRRLQHDRELGGCWERWQLCGDMMRGGSAMPLPGDFAERVRSALAEDGETVQAQARAAAQGRGRWLPWAGSAALAASVAAVALLVGRGTGPAAGEAAVSFDSVVAAPASTLPLAAEPQPGSPVPVSTDDGAGGTGALVAATAIAAVTAPARRGAAQRNPRQAIATRRQDRAVATETTEPAEAGLLANAQAVPGQGSDAAPSLPATDNPLLSDVQPQGRPWPRAIVAGMPVSAFSVDLQASRPSYNAFEPRLPKQQPESPPSAAEAPAP